MAEGAEEENQQFEQVLSRLDALMKRSHSGEATPPHMAEPAPPEPDIYFEPKLIGTVEEAWAESSGKANESVLVAADEKADIPVLTDVYEGELPTHPDTGSQAEAALADIPPELLDAIQRIVDEECGNMRRAMTERLQSEVLAVLRQQLS